MFNTIVVFAAVIVAILAVFGALCAISDWGEKEGRIFCLFYWYKKWSLKKGKRHAALTKMKARVDERRENNG